MQTEKTAGRRIGALLLLHLAVGLILPFVLLQPLAGPAGFLETGTTMANQVRVAVLLLFVGSAIAIAIAAAGWSIFRHHSYAMAVWLVALGVASFALQASDNAHLLAMLSLSQAYSHAGAAKAELFQGLALVAGSTRRWTHYTFLLVVVSWMFLLFALLFRFRLVPRPLTAVGMVASILQIAAVPLRAFFGYPPEMNLAVPLGPAYGLVAIWLLVKGFSARPLEAERPRNPQASTDSVVARERPVGEHRG